MTLIQTLITDDLIIQVADRRLTNAATGMLVDDQYTKLVCWNFNFSIGFTGLARIDRAQRRSTSEWIAETICDYGLFEDGVAALARVASERVGKLPKAWPDKRLGILVAGFDGRTDPLVAEIANFEAGGPMPGDPTNFTVKRVSRLQGRAVGYRITGAGLTEKWQHQMLIQRVPRALRKPKPEGVTYAVKLMVAVQRSIAKTNSRVGTDAMAVTIPRTTFGERILAHLNGGRIMTKVDSNIIGGTGGPEFTYFDTEGFDYRQFGPHTAGNGMAVADLMSTADPDNPDYQSVSIRILKWPKPPAQSGARTQPG
ncbi:MULTISPECIES: hypothetical protein [Mycobacterium]|uniref:Uncharacterized protein n=5 Tax=Mycobacterium TaxID=1763 RepID=A0A557Y1A3_9MYCO|nr:MULTISPECIES: hypothetical protein [Mycobacterium]ARV80833.1 hypothetical protein BWK49_05745 [Mycobacterium intracellulare subsp. chimaera]ASL07821.1 hypothetical protein MYCODSM44623_01062 [Mycobacterium intracellulare subsp. chimaera]ASL13474.1 hypothetical protein MYCOZU2_01032 [Mycobacterium intracellulare subsp. chimaera]ASL19608.1 hypothetical protein MYCOZU1_01157 [Mycobacterium intracellulare subsp. chimaera]ELR83591.1 hypothetical protein W7U_00085 [Mycobacterium sp. H4Y]